MPSSSQIILTLILLSGCSSSFSSSFFRIASFVRFFIEALPHHSPFRICIHQMKYTMIRRSIECFTTLSLSFTIKSKVFRNSCDDTHFYGVSEMGARVR